MLPSALKLCLLVAAAQVVSRVHGCSDPAQQLKFQGQAQGRAYLGGQLSFPRCGSVSAPTSVVPAVSNLLRQICSHFLSLYKGLCRAVHSEAVSSIFFFFNTDRFSNLYVILAQGHANLLSLQLEYMCFQSEHCNEASVWIDKHSNTLLSVQNVVQRLWGPSVHGHNGDSSPCCVGINSEELFQP